MKDGPQGIWKDALSGRIETSDMAIVPSDSLATVVVALPDNWIEFDDLSTAPFGGECVTRIAPCGQSARGCRPSSSEKRVSR
jgi:hypothetical protein